MWGMKTETITGVVGAQGFIKKGLQLASLSCKKITLLGTAHTLRMVLSEKATFISAAVTQYHGLDPALQEKKKNTEMYSIKKNNHGAEWLLF